MKQIKLLLLSLCFMMAVACTENNQTVFHRVRAHVLSDKQHITTFIDTMFTYQKGDTICIFKKMKGGVVRDNGLWTYSQDKPKDTCIEDNFYRTEVRAAVIDSIYPKLE